jgi:hypothetical protein
LPLMVAFAVPPKILNMLSMTKPFAPAPAENTGSGVRGKALPQSLAAAHVTSQLSCPIFTFTVRVAVALPFSLVAV